MQLSLHIFCSSSLGFSALVTGSSTDGLPQSVMRITGFDVQSSAKYIFLYPQSSTGWVQCGSGCALLFRSSSLSVYTHNRDKLICAEDQADWAQTPSFKYTLFYITMNSPIETWAHKSGAQQTEVPGTAEELDTLLGLHGFRTHLSSEKSQKKQKWTFVLFFFMHWNYLFFFF